MMIEKEWKWLVPRETFESLLHIASSLSVSTGEIGFQINHYYPLSPANSQGRPPLSFSRLQPRRFALLTGYRLRVRITLYLA